ncbi:MAG: ArsA-related P-loop ATPase [Acidimicrobiia bacterium]|nr:ArsA-related P-loop ATPase [Acidimicrobiia bacterium]MDX2468398.1 ArsA-related P-loop ATPase [Acidimicrobiia bacterium]
MLDRKLTFISGKGGVGKSAVTASLALLAARRGLRVLVVGMVEGIGAASHLAAKELTYEPRQVRAGIEALSVNRTDALDEYFRLQLHVPRAAPTKLLSSALSVLAETAPGVREIVTIGKPVFELWQARYDLVLVDAPPLGQLFSYLRAPNTIADLVPAGPIRSQADRMRKALLNIDTTSLILVTTPDELPVLETKEALDRLIAEPVIDLAGVVTNRVLPELALTKTEISTLPTGPHRTAAEHHLAVQEQQHRWLPEVSAGHRLPHLFGLHTAGEVAEQLADIWDELI